MEVDKYHSNNNSIRLYWWIVLPDTVELEFKPSISKVGSSEWHNMTWTGHLEYTFQNLEPHTRYPCFKFYYFLLHSSHMYQV